MPIICLFGPDGSGKSTLAGRLVDELRCRGFRSKVVWMRGGHTFISLFTYFLSGRTTFIVSGNSSYSIDVPKSMRRIWQILEFVSVLPVILVRYKLPSFFGYWVIADRYILDFIVWVTLITKDRSFPYSLISRFLLALSLKTNLQVYVTARLEDLINRRRDNPEFLKKQMELYGRLAQYVRATILDTSKEQVHDSLKKLVKWIGI